MSESTGENLWPLSRNQAIGVAIIMGTLVFAIDDIEPVLDILLITFGLALVLSPLWSPNDN